MQKFISYVVKDLLLKNKKLTNHTLILPNKRAGVFLREELKKQYTSIAFLPKIISIEDFITEISLIQPLPKIEIIFKFYKIYLENTNKNSQVSFEHFLNWATILIQDFNEIDRHLINPNKFFKYLSDIHRIENWFLKKEINETNLTKKHFDFFNQFEIYYNKFYKHLVTHKKAYQGLQYREATKKTSNYLSQNTNTHFVFIGFNALNLAEETIFKKILDAKKGTIYFDIDQFFIQNKLPYANFIQKYKETWQYYNTNIFKTISNDFSTIEKEIHIIGVPKNVTLIKQAGLILKNLNSKNNKLEQTALVLANENLLTTTLNSLPKDVTKVNITMGYPLKNVELSNLFTLLFKLHLNKEKIGNNKIFYYKNITQILNHFTIESYFKKTKTNKYIVNYIINNNLNFIGKSKIDQIIKNQVANTKILDLLFSDWKNANIAIANCLMIINLLIKSSTENLNTEYLIRFKKLFQQLENLNKKYNYIDNLSSLLSIYQQLLQSENLSFKGVPLSGLQIMGMLETRVLDFKNVIITSVNEGFIPSGKTNNSFIPFDVKKEFGIPTYNEKDAIFSYHFYRLLQRAKNIYLLYNTETDDFGSGEQSRFITQLEVLKTQLPNIKIKKYNVGPQLNKENNNLIKIIKTAKIHASLKKLAANGLTPTTLTNYIYNPIAFYKNKILKISSLDEIEETIASNTFGTIIHKTLEDLYKPYLGLVLTQNHFLKIKKKITQTTSKYFIKNFKNGDITRGKNLLALEVSKNYILKLIDIDLNLVKSKKELKILNLEFDIETTIQVDTINFPIKIKGQVDRIDQLDDVIRIIDYKTGKTEQKNLNIKNWELITTDYKKYNKSFQVLMYAYIYAKTNSISFDVQKIESGNISFKNLKQGFLKVNKKLISTNDIQNFETELFKLIQDIYTAKYFVENENLPF